MAKRFRIILSMTIISVCATQMALSRGMVPATWSIYHKVKQEVLQKGNLNYYGNNIPYLSQQDLRLGKADTAQVVFIVEGVKSGLFRYSRTDNSSPDDSAMVLVSGKKRFVRENNGFLRPQYWGAMGDGVTDDSPAIQKCLNYVTRQGVRVVFSSGTYVINHSLKLKPVTGSPTFNFNITLEGDGAGKTIFRGGKDLTSDLLLMDTGGNVAGKDNFVIIKQIQFNANRASRCFYGTHVVGLKIEDCMFLGGEICNVQIGTETFKESYSVYVTRCYFHGGSYNGGQNQGNLRLYNTRMIVVDAMETDGGKYGIDILNSDKAIITNCKIEGSKSASISVRGYGGGEHRITNNLLNPYVGHEPNAQFDGRICGIELISVNGSNAYNSISNNTILVENESVLPKTGSLSGLKGNFQISAGKEYIVTGEKSGATGFVNGYNSKLSRIVVGGNSAKFVEGENILQKATGSTAVISGLKINKSYGIYLGGTGGYNTLTGNVIRLKPTFGVYSDSDSNILTGNVIEASTGVYANNNIVVTGNHFYCPGGTAINKVRGDSKIANNSLGAGNLVGVPKEVTPTVVSASSVVGSNALSNSQNISRLTIKERDAIKAPEEGKVIYNLSTHDIEFFNGSMWKSIR